MALPFHPHDHSFNRANALYLAHAADVAYHRAPAAAALERLGLQAVSFRHKVTRTRAFLGMGEGFAVLAFRGTDPVTLPNWLTDVRTRLVERGEYTGRVHRGFSSVLGRSWGQVEQMLAEVGDRPLFLTGHSMGGALAVLTACRLVKSGRPPVAIYTFGSPRVGDRAFCAGYTSPTYRIVNRLDIVPEMPLPSVARLLPAEPRFTSTKFLGRLKRLGERFPSYGHVDTFVYIDRDGVITLDADVEPWHTNAVARAVATRGKSFLEGVTDHLITNYIRGLEGQAGGEQTGIRRRARVDRIRKVEP